MRRSDEISANERFYAEDSYEPHIVDNEGTVKDAQFANILGFRFSEDTVERL